MTGMMTRGGRYNMIGVHFLVVDSRRLLASAIAAGKHVARTTIRHEQMAPWGTP